MEQHRFSRLLSLLLCLLLCSLPFTAAAENLLVNGSFEETASNGIPIGWQTGAYLTQAGYTDFTIGEDGCDGNASAVIRSYALNDARFQQRVTVKPNSIYKLSGYIRATGAGSEGWGANLSIEGVYLYVDGAYETDGEWRYTELYGQTGPQQTELTVYARLGGYSGESMGEAAFDDIRLEKIDKAPTRAVVDKWYSEPIAVNPVVEDDSSDGKPAWPWLIAMSCAYLLLGVSIMRALTKQHELKDTAEKTPLFLFGALVAAYIVRIVIAMRIEGYQVDVGCFLSWGRTMANYGMGSFYSATSFCDYPPAYMVVLGLLDQLSSLLPAVNSTVIYKQVPILCDLAMSVLLYRAAYKHFSFTKLQAGMLAVLVAFNPVLVMTSAAWCQIDSVLTFLLLIVLLLALDKNWIALFPVYVLAVLVKPQALMVGPLGLIVFLREFVAEKDGKKCFALPQNFRKMAAGLGLAAVVVAIIVAPFAIGEGGLSWLFEKYAQTLSSYAYATVNTANLYYPFGGNWSAITNTASAGVCVVLCLVAIGWGAYTFLSQRKAQMKCPWLEGAVMLAFALAFAIMGVTGAAWQTVGFTAMGLSFAIVILWYLRMDDIRALPYAGSLLFLLLFVLGVKMHERYLFPALAFLALAFVCAPRKRTLALLLILSGTMAINEGIVLDNSLRLGSSMGHLNLDTQTLANVLSWINVACIPLALWNAQDMLLKTESAPLPTFVSMPSFSKKEPAAEKVSDPSLHWKKPDWILVSIVTLVYGCFALWNLGSMKAPQTFWISSSADEQVIIDIGEHKDDIALAYFCAVSYNDFSIAVSDDGENWSKEYWCQMNEGSCYQWKYMMPCLSADGVAPRQYGGGNTLGNIQRISGRYIRVTAQQIGLKLGEIILRDADGNEIPFTVLSQIGGFAASSLYSEGGCIGDEPGTLEGEPGWFNSTYFDEIYHARTAKELNDAQPPYEWTHPPLGKILMGIAVSIFGMTPFGWRFAGTLIGILMLPAMYLLVKQLTKSTFSALAAMLLMTFDCMHFAQSRIATIDSFPVFFIILSYFFMTRFLQRDLMKSTLKQLLPDLALCGLMMALSIASKWIGLYSAVGLALLYFYHCLAMLKAEAAKGKATLIAAFRRFCVLCAWCVLFFVAVPLLVYLLVYIPHMASRMNAYPGGLLGNLDEFVRQVWQEQQNMFGYHSTPGLGMDHAFHSPWYEWPTMARPMYYAMAQYMQPGYALSIFCLGNPVIWYSGIAGLALCALWWAKRHVYTLDGSDTLLHLQSSDQDDTLSIVLIGFLSQFLPWVLVPRGTYIYHYFASLPFLMTATVVILGSVTKRFPKIGKLLIALLLIASLAMFIILYPYASGTAVPYSWLDLGRNFANVYYSR